MPLDPRAQLLLDMLNRIEAPRLPEQAVDIARRNFHKLLHVYRDEPSSVESITELVIPRRDVAGGPLKARLYKPFAEHAGPLPVLLWFHGGGWVMGDLASYDGLCRELANIAKCAVLAVDYRLAPENRFPAAVDDAWWSLRWLVSASAELGLDDRRIAVGGDSAGGNLAAVICHMARDEGAPDIRMQLLIYPSTNQLSNRDSQQRYGEGFFLDAASIAWFQHNYLPADADYSDWRASPLLAARFDGLPQALILTAEYDPLTDDAIAYGDKLVAADVAVKHINYPGMIHGFMTMPKALPLAHQAIAEAAAGLRIAFSS